MFRIKSIVLVTALMSAGAAFSAHLPEDAYPGQPSVSATEGRSRIDVANEAARYNLAGKPGLLSGEDRPAFVQSFGQRDLSRAEVIADLRLWQQAGLSHAISGEASPDVFAKEYQAKLSQYHELRNGPIYAESVRQIGS
jgi:hypothetical protein